MNQEQKKDLENRLASLDSNERNKLYKRAAQMRKLAQRKTDSPPRRIHRRELDDEEEALAEPRRPRADLFDWVLRVLELERDDAPATEPVLPVGTVIAIGPRTAEVVLDGAVVVAGLPKELAARQQSDLAVGDLVEVRQRSADAAVIEAVRPRRTKLSRPDPGPRLQERVIVANVDSVVVVVSVVSPPLHPRLIDRYMVAIERGGAVPIIAVNKIDLLGRDELGASLVVLQPYERLGVPIVRCCASTGEGTDELRSRIAAQVSAFVGHSGVGKSSLLNNLKPELALEVREVSQGYGRGRHTTTRSTMWDLGGGTRVIDTPGVRSFGMWKLDADELPWYFPEFADAGRCQFRDCTHTHEPRCAVKESVQSGSISQHRYDAYRRILESL